MRAGALDFLGVIRDREAALLVGAQLIRAPDDLGIDEDLRMGLRLRLALLVELPRDLLFEIADHDALHHADLDRREANAARRIHRIEHVARQITDLVRDGDDGLANLPQAGIGQYDDGFARHDGGQISRAA